VPMTSVSDHYITSIPRPDAMAQVGEIQKKLVGSLARLPERQMQVFVMSRSTPWRIFPSYTADRIR
jgi:hypothetical protein